MPIHSKGNGLLRTRCHPPELALSGGLSFQGLDVIDIHRNLLHAFHAECNLFGPVLVSVLLLFEDDHQLESNEPLKESEERAADGEVELIAIADVRLSGTDEGLKPPHHGLLENEAVADDLSVAQTRNPPIAINASGSEIIATPTVKSATPKTSAAIAQSIFFIVTPYRLSEKNFGTGAFASGALVARS